jgi:hypothetical protein
MKPFGLSAQASNGSVVAFVRGTRSAGRSARGRPPKRVRLQLVKAHLDARELRAVAELLIEAAERLRV